MTVWASYALRCDYPAGCGSLLGHAHCQQELEELIDDARARGWVVRSRWGEMDDDRCPVHILDPLS